MNKLKLALAVCAAATVLAPLSASAQVFDGRNLIGTGIGAGIGGAIGSNLAGGGVQDEGTAIGALVGGAIGYGIANSTRPSNNYGPYRGNYGSTYGGNYGPAYGGHHGANHGGYYGGGASRYGNNYPGSGYNHGGGYAYEYYNSYGYTAPTQVYMPAPQYVYGGHVVSQVYTVPQYTTYTYIQQPTIVSRPSTYVAPQLKSTYCYSTGSSGYRSLSCR
ncbi:MAG: hypothetical protein EX271_09320 [Acidimicrobiales bacterium]|nr:hypothetical protein [Hyphomonadaceae bacterium]RZV40855.1 MAG: hypothetical protein EX271_09320 [Acidimicrobiales bacterium]